MNEKELTKISHLIETAKTDLETGINNLIKRLEYIKSLTDISYGYEFEDVLNTHDQIHETRREIQTLLDELKSNPIVK